MMAENEQMKRKLISANLKAIHDGSKDAENKLFKDKLACKRQQEGELKIELTKKDKLYKELQI